MEWMTRREETMIDSDEDDDEVMTKRMSLRRVDGCLMKSNVINHRKFNL